VHQLIYGYIIAFPGDSTSHEIHFAVAGSSKASVFYPLPLLKHIIEVPEMAGWCSVFMHSASLLLHSLIISHIFYGIPFSLTTKHASNFFQKQIRKPNKTQNLQDLFQLYILHKTIFFNKKFVIIIAVCDSSQ
jgi:hypothetical protein